MGSKIAKLNFLFCLNLLSGHPLAYVSTTRLTLQAGTQRKAKPDLVPQDLLSPVHFARASGAISYLCSTAQLFPGELWENLLVWTRMWIAQRSRGPKVLEQASGNFCHKEGELQPQAKVASVFWSVSQVWSAPLNGKKERNVCKRVRGCFCWIFFLWVENSWHTWGKALFISPGKQSPHQNRNLRGGGSRVGYYCHVFSGRCHVRGRSLIFAHQSPKDLHWKSLAKAKEKKKKTFGVCLLEPKRNSFSELKQFCKAKKS